MADTADQEVIRIVAQDQTGPGVQSAEARLKAGASRMASAGKIPISIIDKATSPLKAIGQQFQDIARIAERAAIGTLASMATLNLAHTVEEGIGRVQDFGTATIKMARETGQSAETASTLLAVLGELGVDSDAASRSLGIFSKGIHGIEDATEKALNGGKGVADAMRDLGVSFVDAQKNARPMNDVLLDVADRFHAMPDGVDKTAIAMQLFGRSGKDMIRFLDLGSQGIKDATDAATKFGMVLTNENVATLKEFGLAQRESTMAMHGFELQVGLLMLPLMTKLAEAGTSIASGLNATVVPAIGRLGSMIAGLPLQSMLNTLLSLGGRFATWLRGVLVIGLTDLWELLSPTRTFLGYALRWLVETAWPAFLGVMDRVAGFINDTLLPRLHDLSDWLNLHLGPGLEWLANTGWPALQTAGGVVMGWIEANVLPTLQRMWEWLSPHLQDAVDWWTSTGWPSLQGAWSALSSFVITEVVPRLMDVRDWIWTHAQEAIDWAVNTGWPNLQTAMGNVSTFVKTTLIPDAQSLVSTLNVDLRNALTWLTDTGFPNAASAARDFQAALVTTRDDAGKMGAWDDLKNAWTDLKQIGGDLKVVVDGLAGAFTGGKPATDDMGKAISDAGGNFDIAAGMVKSMTDRIQSFTDGALTVVKMIRAIGDAFNFVGSSIDNIGGAISRLKAAIVSAGANPTTFITSLFEGAFSIGKDLGRGGLGVTGPADAAAADTGAPPAPPAAGFAREYQMGGWLTEPIVGMGLRSGQRYSFVEDGQPEYVTPAGGAAAGPGAGSGHTFNFGGITINVDGSNGPAAAWADGSEQLFNEFVRRVDMSLANRPQGAGRGAY